MVNWTESWDSDPIINHIKVKDVGQTIHDQVRADMQMIYEQTNPPASWLQERLGEPVAFIEHRYKPYIWEGQNWRVHADKEWGIVLEVRTSLDIHEVLDALDDYMKKVKLK